MVDVSRSRVDETIAPSGSLKPVQSELTPAFSDVPKRIEIHRSLVDAVGTQFEMANAGSDRRKLFEDLMRGVPMDAAIKDRPDVDLGPQGAKTLAVLQAYVNDRRLYEGRVASSNLKPMDVAVNVAKVVPVREVDAIKGNSAEIGHAISQTQIYNATQSAAISKEKARINDGLQSLGEALGKMEKHTPAYDQAAKDYENLRSMVVEGGAARLAVQKGVAADGLKVQLEQGGVIDHQRAAAVSQMLQVHGRDAGVAGEVRPAIGTRFAGWERPEDVVLTPAAEARIALAADPNHNPAYLGACADGSEQRPYYAYLTANHEESLDKPLTEAPKYDPSLTLAGAAGAGVVSWKSQVPQAPEVVEGEIVEEGGLVARSQGGGAGMGTAIPHASPAPIDISRIDPQNSKPLVVSADHIDSRIQEKELRRAEESIRNRQLVNLAFTGGSTVLSIVEVGKNLAGNPDGGIGNAFMSSAQLGLNTVNQTVGHIQQHRQEKDRIHIQEIERQKSDQGTAGQTYAAAAMGAKAQLDAIGGHPSVVSTLHTAEMEVRALHADRLNAGWEAYKGQNSTELYKGLLSQAAQSQDKALAGVAVKGLKSLNDKEAKGQSFTEADFHAVANSNLAQTIWHSDGMKRLRQVSTASATDCRSSLLALERTYMGASKTRFEQEAIQTDPALARDLHRSLISQKGVTVSYGPNGQNLYQMEFNDPKKPQGVVQLDSEAIGKAFQEKWAVERNLQEQNIRLIDKAPLVGDAMRRHGLDAASVLESTYTHQASASTNSVRIADGIRAWADKNALNPRLTPGTDLIPRGWDIVGEEKHIGVADVGNGTYVASLTGFNHAGKAVDGRLLVFQQNRQGELELVGKVNVDPTKKIDSKGLEGAIREQLKNGWAASIENAEAIKQGVHVNALPAHIKSKCDSDAEVRVSQVCRFLNDRHTMSNMARGLEQGSTREGLNHLSRSPHAFSIFDFPKASHVTHPDVNQRFQHALPVALAEANSDLHNGMRQRQDLSGLLNLVGRMDSHRNHKETRRDFDTLRNAFDDPRVRTAAKSAAYQNPQHVSSGPGHAPVRIEV